MSGRGAGRGRGRGRGRAGSPKKTKTKKGKVGAKGSKGGSKVVVVPEEHAEERRSGSEDEEERPELELEEDRGSEEGDAPPETGTGRPDEGEEGGLEGTGESWSAQRLRDETLIAEFFDARPYFYNKRDENYKRTPMKNAEMADLVKELGENWTHDTVMKRFWSNRTDFGKLRDKIKKTPSPPPFS